MREKSFITAAARRRANPIVWHIDDTTVRLKASIELADIADALHEIQQPIPADANQIQVAADKRLLLVHALTGFMIPEDIDAFLAIQSDLDFTLLSEMLNEAITEYTGAQNPTSEPSSSDGS
jgi:hypothetical protein